MSGAASQSLFHRRGWRAGSIELSAHSSVAAGPVDRQHPQLVVAGAAVDEGEPVRVDGDGALGDVTRGERREDGLAGRGVDEVEVVVVGAEHQPGATAPLEHRRLADPSGAAPHLGLAVLAATPAHGPVRVAPRHLRGLGHRALAVVSAAGVAPEGEQPLHRGAPGPADLVAVGQCRWAGGRGGGQRRGWSACRGRSRWRLVRGRGGRLTRASGEAVVGGGVRESGSTCARDDDRAIGPGAAGSREHAHDHRDEEPPPHHDTVPVAAPR